MKRIGNLYQEIISIENLSIADCIAQVGKSEQYGVLLHNKNKEQNIIDLHKMLLDKTFQGDNRIQFNENEFSFAVVNFIEMKKEDYISFYADEILEEQSKQEQK